MMNIRGRLKKLEFLLPNPRASVESLEKMAKGARRRLSRKLDQMRENLQIPGRHSLPRSKMSVAERLATASTPEEFQEVREAMAELAENRLGPGAGGNGLPPPGQGS